MLWGVLSVLACMAAVELRLRLEEDKLRRRAILDAKVAIMDELRAVSEAGELPFEIRARVQSSLWHVIKQLDSRLQK
jgi:hypothetical protein